MSNHIVCSRISRAVALCAFAGALLSLPVASQAASKTLTISGKPATTVAVGAHYSFQPTAKDTVKSRIKFNIYNKPDWATFDGNTGKLSGTPHRFDTGTYKNITIRLTDWYGYVTTVPFSITVTRAPTNPVSDPTKPGSTVTTGKTPTGGGTTGGGTTGSTGGTSSGSGSGSGSGTSSGGAPSAPGGSTHSAGSVTLDWTPPTENTDGSTMTNLAGYTVHYGTDRTKLTQSIKVSNAGVATFVVDNLTAGTWYFSVTSFNAQGVESTYSGVVSTKVL